MIQIKLTGALLMACAALSAQGPQDQPIYRVTVTSRTAKAISYQHRSGATSIDFKGTDLLPTARGLARVTSKQGRIAIDVDFQGLQPATKNGAEYLTYVLWAVTPEGRTANLGEVLLNGTTSKLNVTTDLQVFGLIVTAEPYYAVSQPSDLVVMENVVRGDTVGKIEAIDAKYELLQRGQYQRLANPLALKLDRRQPIELYEARNAVQIARAMGADKFAAETFQKAENSLSQAEAYQTRNAGRKPVAMTARESVQMAEDARVIAVKRQEEDALNDARIRSSEREAGAQSARASAEFETSRVKRDAETARLNAQAESERLTRENSAQAAASLAEADRVKRENDARMSAATSEADRLKMQNEARETASATEAERLKRENDKQRAASQAELDGAAKQRAQLEAENGARETAAATEAERLKRENDKQRAASQAELEGAAKQRAQLEAENGARETAAATEAERLKRENDAQRAASPGRARRRSQAAGAARSGQGGIALEPVGAIQYDPANPGHIPRVGGQHVGRPVRHR